MCCRQWHHVITGPPNGPVLFCSLASVVCRLSASVTLPAGGPAAWRMGGRGAPTLHGGPVRLRPVGATPCFVRLSLWRYVIVLVTKGKNVNVVAGRYTKFGDLLSDLTGRLPVACGRSTRRPPADASEMSASSRTEAATCVPALRRSSR